MRGWLKRNWLKRNWLPIAMGFLCFIWGVYNFNKNCNFFDASLSTIVSIMIAVIVSFYLVQKKNDLIREKEKIDGLVYKIQEIIMDNSFGSVEDEDIIRKNLIMQRSVANKFEYLSVKFKRLNDKINTETKESLKNAADKYNEFKEFYGNHYTDKEYIKKSFTEITNYKTLIDDFCDKIHIQLFES